VQQITQLLRVFFRCWKRRGNPLLFTSGICRNRTAGSRHHLSSLLILPKICRPCRRDKTWTVIHSLHRIHRSGPARFHHRFYGKDNSGTQSAPLPEWATHVLEEYARHEPFHRAFRLTSAGGKSAKSIIAPSTRARRFENGGAVAITPDQTLDSCRQRKDPLRAQRRPCERVHSRLPDRALDKKLLSASAENARRYHRS
jgi:hypothetical protein